MKTYRLCLVIIAVTIIFLPTFVCGQSGEVPTWPKLPKQLVGVYIATSSATIPAFPTALTGYRDAGKMDYWNERYNLHGTIRIFDGHDWATIPDFPNSANHCGEGLFMIRWRSANPDVRIMSNAALRPEPTHNDVKKAKTGNFGYMVGTNCEQPLFKLAGTVKGNKSNLVDIHYELKFWQVAP
jgi:hypothetical protein